MKKRFTLIEMMTVVAIIIIVLGMTLPSVGPMFRSSALKGKASEIKILMMSARAMAATFQSVYCITFNFDSIGDMNGDGAPGILNQDDDCDGITDEDIQIYKINAAVAKDATYFYTYGGGTEFIYRGIPSSISNNEVTDSIDNNNNGYIDEMAYIAEYSGNDDEDNMMDEGDTIFIEDLGDNDYNGTIWPIDDKDEANRSNEFKESRTKQEKVEELKQSEELFMGNSVVISRIWADNDLLLVRESLGLSATDKSIGYFGIHMDKLDMLTTGNHPNNSGGRDYCFSAFIFMPDGCLYYDNGINKIPIGKSLTIEIRDRASKDRRLITVKGNGLTLIEK